MFEFLFRKYSLANGCTERSHCRMTNKEKANQIFTLKISVWVGFDAAIETHVDS